jgi:hypothetical protein
MELSFQHPLDKHISGIHWLLKGGYSWSLHFLLTTRKADNPILTWRDFTSLINISCFIYYIMHCDTNCSHLLAINGYRKYAFDCTTVKVLCSFFISDPYVYIWSIVCKIHNDHHSQQKQQMYFLFVNLLWKPKSGYSWSLHFLLTTRKADNPILTWRDFTSLINISCFIYYIMHCDTLIRRVWKYQMSNQNT